MREMEGKISYSLRRNIEGVKVKGEVGGLRGTRGASKNIFPFKRGHVFLILRSSSSPFGLQSLQGSIGFQANFKNAIC